MSSDGWCKGCAQYKHAVLEGVCKACDTKRRQHQHTQAVNQLENLAWTVVSESCHNQETPKELFRYAKLSSNGLAIQIADNRLDYRAASELVAVLTGGSQLAGSPNVIACL